MAALHPWKRFKQWLRWASIELFSFCPQLLYPRYWASYKRERKQMIRLMEKEGRTERKGGR